MPSRAIVAVKKLWPEQAIPFAVEVQKARYLFGQDLNLYQTYLKICDDLKLDSEKFMDAFHCEFIKNATLETFELARQYANSYPTLLAVKNNEEIVLEQGYTSFETLEKRIDQLLY